VKTIFRYDLDVDGRHHDFDLSGTILAAGSRRPRTVEFWASHDDTAARTRRRLQAFGTGHPVPAHAIHHGTVVDAGDQALIWHLLEICPNDRDGDGDCGQALCPICGTRRGHILLPNLDRPAGYGYGRRVPLVASSYAVPR
jgi:hypothetical protein